MATGGGGRSRTEASTGRGAPRCGPVGELVIDHAVQQIFEIYIPEAVYHHAAAQRLLAELGSMAEGATVYQSVEGSWNRQIEAVRVVRLAITAVDSKGQRLWEIEELREWMRGVIVEFMERLEASRTHLEESVFFNDWTANGTFVTRRE